MSRLRLIVFAGLASCVFLWGLQYKLSLYETGQSSHHVPMAKLLSRNELSDTTESSTLSLNESLFRSQGAAFPQGSLILLIVCLSGLPVSHSRVFDDDWNLRLTRALRESFLVRPPPALN